MTSLHRAATFLAPCAVFLVGGCASVRAPVDRTLTRGGVTAHVEEAGARFKETRVALTVQRVPPGMKLLRASLSASSGAYCEGLQSEKLGRRAGAAADEPLGTNERLVLEFPEKAVDVALGPAPRLDLLVQSARGTMRCLPFPLTAGEEPLDWSSAQHFTLGLDIALEAYTQPIGAVAHTALFFGTLGAWVDRFHFVVAAGIGGAECPKGRCPVDSDNPNFNESTVFPLQAGVQTALWEPSEVSVGLSARYRVVKLVADTLQGRESYWAHGPVLAPYAAIVMPPLGNTGLGGSKQGFLGLEVPVGYTFAANGDRSLSVGVVVSTFVTAF